MQEVLCVMLYISYKYDPKLSREKTKFFLNKLHRLLSSKTLDYCFSIYRQILTSQTFAMKINKLSLEKKLCQINQRDKQFVTVNIQQNFFFGKFCSFYSVFTLLERFIAESMKLKIRGTRPSYLF